MAKSIFNVKTRSRKPVADRLWEKVNRGGPDECWPWVAKRQHKHGYGRLSIGHNSEMRSNRVAWEITNGPIPDGMKVLHKCDNPPCCNPKHLVLGTQKENMLDKESKGRGTKPPIHFGEGHHSVTIPDIELPFIRKSTMTLNELADHYGVCKTTIWNIRTFKTRNVPVK